MKTKKNIRKGNKVQLFDLQNAGLLNSNHYYYTQDGIEIKMTFEESIIYIFDNMNKNAFDYYKEAFVKNLNNYEIEYIVGCIKFYGACFCNDLGIRIFNILQFENVIYKNTPFNLSCDFYLTNN